MMTQQPFKIFTSHMPDPMGVEHTFYFKVYQEQHEMYGEFRHFKRLISIKAFRLVVEHVTMYDKDHEIVDFKEHDFGYISARSGEVVYAYRLLKDCSNFEQMQEILDDLDVDFRVAMEKDALREVKKLLGLRPLIQETPVLRRNKRPNPMPQIHIPWHNKRRRK